MVAAVDGVAVPEILAGSARLGETLPRTHDLHLISQSVAAVSAAQSLDTEAFIAASDVAAFVASLELDTSAVAVELNHNCPFSSYLFN